MCSVFSILLFLFLIFNFTIDSFNFGFPSHRAMYVLLINLDLNKFPNNLAEKIFRNN